MGEVLAPSSGEVRLLMSKEARDTLVFVLVGIFTGIVGFQR